MGANLQELTRKVMIRLKNPSGLGVLAIEESINDAIKVIAMVHDFDDLMVEDTANCSTSNNTANYVIATNDWNLSNCKDIFSIKLMANDESRKLIYVPFRELDQKIPYPDRLGTGKSRWYTQRGNTFTLIKTPDDEYSLYITHSKWPTVLANANDTSPYPTEIDLIVVSLATEMATSISTGQPAQDWTQRAMSYMGIAKRDDDVRPDRSYVAQPFQFTVPAVAGNYWLDPLVKENI